MERAKDLYARGQLAFEGGHFIEAAHLFEGAYEASRRPTLLWNTALACRRQFEIDGDTTHLRRPRALYQNFVDLAPNSQDREDATKKAAEIDEMIRRAPPRVPPPEQGARPPSLHRKSLRQLQRRPRPYPTVRFLRPPRGPRFTVAGGCGPGSPVS